MNNYEDWAQLVAKRLKGEADIITAIEKDELDDAAATDAFARAVLEPFLPENFGLGSGRVVDAFGNYSEYLDIIIYNRDFPRISMRGAHEAYLYESVLGAFAIRAKFIRKTFFDAMNACASLSHLETNLDKTVLVKLAKKNGLRPGPNKTFVHEDPLRTGRFELIGRPPAFVFGFSGIKNSYRQLQENIELWIQNRQKVEIATPMKSLPAVIATQGCFAWRNAAPLALSNREMLGIGNDDAPVRLIVLQLLYLLNRRLNVTSDGYGLKPNLNAYLSQFSAPKFELGVGNVAEVLNFNKEAGDAEVRAARDTQRFSPARDHAAAEMLAAAEKAKESRASKPVAAELEAASKHEAAAAAALEAASKHEAEAAAELKAASKLEAEAAAARNDTSEAPAKAEAPAAAGLGDAAFDKPSPFAAPPPTPPASEASSGSGLGDVAFDKPSPFASAPTPVADEAPMPEPELPRSPAPAAPLGSAPIPPMQGSADPKPPTAPLGSAPIPPAAEPEKAPPSAPLGSAPIPPMQEEPAAPAAAPAASPIPPKPPVDIDLGHGDGEDKADDEDDEFIQTVVIPPNAAASAKENQQRSSTDAFIARVKEQLSTPDAPEKKDQDFSSTIPQ